MRCINEVMEHEVDELRIFGIGHSDGVDWDAWDGTILDLSLKHE